MVPSSWWVAAAWLWLPSCLSCCPQDFYLAPRYGNNTWYINKDKNKCLHPWWMKDGHKSLTSQSLGWVVGYLPSQCWAQSGWWWGIHHPDCVEACSVDTPALIWLSMLALGFPITVCMLGTACWHVAIVLVLMLAGTRLCWLCWHAHRADTQRCWCWGCWYWRWQVGLADVWPCWWSRCGCWCGCTWCVDRWRIRYWWPACHAAFHAVHLAVCCAAFCAACCAVRCAVRHAHCCLCPAGCLHSWVVGLHSVLCLCRVCSLHWWFHWGHQPGGFGQWKGGWAEQSCCCWLVWGVGQRYSEGIDVGVQCWCRWQTAHARH